MRRQQLTEAQITALLDPSTDQRELVRYYTLSAASGLNLLVTAIILWNTRTSSAPLPLCARPRMFRTSYSLTSPRSAGSMCQQGGRSKPSRPHSRRAPYANRVCVRADFRAPERPKSRSAHLYARKSGGIYFGGYAASVPILASATDGIDGRWIFVGCSLLAAGSSFAFAGCADGFWMALLLRFLNGVALAGVHMPGLKLLVDRVAGRARARGTAIYTSSYAVGTAASFL